MGITVPGATGEPGPMDQGAPTTSVDYVGGVGAGNMAVVQATVKDTTATFTDPDGYIKIGEKDGGTGVTSNDTGTTKVAAWYRILDGTETADVVVFTDIGESLAAGMTIYAPSDGAEFAAPIFVAGSDNTHDTTWTPTGFAAWSQAVAPGDVVIAAFSVDTDTVTVTSPTLTQTGITFDWLDPGTGEGRGFRIASRATGGPISDIASGLHSWDWVVTAGANTNAPSYTYTPNVAVCGATMLIRIREVDLGTGVYSRQLIVGP